MPNVFDVAGLRDRILEIEQLQSKPDFWNDQYQAQELSRELADRQGDVDFIDSLQIRLRDSQELWRLAMSENDTAEQATLGQELAAIKQDTTTKERELQFNGPHDRAGVIVTIQSGAGGTDAQDWSQMLERMYLRFAEKQHWLASVIDRAMGEEAGIKRTTIEIRGKFAYGILRGEHGVHRLVRLSPFNADNLRQTSFARVEILPLLSAQEAPIIDSKDLKIDTFRASGAGGQHVNKTDSAVRITHLPTGIVTQCQNQRSQAQNKAYALTVLQSKLKLLAEEQHIQELKDLKGETKEAAWGNQIRSYTLHPYTLVKDHRSKHEERDVKAVLDGDLSGFVPEL